MSSLLRITTKPSAEDLWPGRLSFCRLNADAYEKDLSSFNYILYLAVTKI